MIYCCGMIAYDVLFCVKEFPQPSSSAYIEKMEEPIITAIISISTYHPRGSFRITE